MSRIPHNGGAPGYHDTPLVAGTFVGVRQWRLSTVSGWLLSAAYTHTWQLGVNTASCQATADQRPPDHRIVHPDCGCGFWAQTAQARRWYKGSVTEDPVVTGVIAGSGRCVIGPLGFRCEHARIVALTRPRRNWLHSNPAGAVTEWLHVMGTRYPGIPIYPSEVELLAEHPLSDLSDLLKGASDDLVS